MALDAALSTDMPAYPIAAPKKPAPQIASPTPVSGFDLGKAATGVTDADRAASEAASAQGAAEGRLATVQGKMQGEQGKYIEGLHGQERSELGALDPGTFKPDENTLGNMAGLFTMVGMLGAFLGGKRTTASAANAQAALTGMLNGWSKGDQAEVARQKAVYDENANYLKSKADQVRDLYKTYEEDAVKVGVPTAQGKYLQGLATEANADVMAARAKYAGAQATQKQADDILRISQSMESKNADINTRVAIANLSAQIRWGGEQDKQGQVLPAEGIKTLVEQRLAGDTSGLTILGSAFSPAGMVNRRMFLDELDNQLKAKGLTGDALAHAHAQYMGEVSGQRALGTQGGRVAGAIGTLQETVPLALQASENVDRSQFPDLNSVGNAVRRGLGDSNIIIFNAYNQALVNDYAQIMKRGGASTDDASKHANDILSTNFSRGQYAVGADTLMQEAGAVQRGLQDAKKVVSGQPSAPTAPNKEGDVSKSKSGKPIVFRNGQWEYQ